MALIQYDSVGKALKIYAARSSGLNVAQTATLSAETWGDPTSPAIITYFKSLDSVESTAIVGGTACSTDVLSANFRYFTPTGGKPMAAYQLDIQNGSSQGSTFGSIAIRAGRKPVNFP